MSVVNTEYDDHYAAASSHKCSACGGKLSHPFVCWMEGGDLCICGNAARRSRTA
jgi:hypothetical protein